MKRECGMDVLIRLARASAALGRLKLCGAAAFALALVLGATASAAAADAAMIEAGHKLAMKICATCHVVEEGQPKPVLHPEAPSFADIAARPDVTEAWLSAFLGHPHGAERRTSVMPPFALTPSQADEAIAYLLSLKPQ